MITAQRGVRRLRVLDDATFHAAEGCSSERLPGLARNLLLSFHFQFQYTLLRFLSYLPYNNRIQKHFFQSLEESKTASVALFAPDGVLSSVDCTPRSVD